MNICVKHNFLQILNRKLLVNWLIRLYRERVFAKIRLMFRLDCLSDACGYEHKKGVKMNHGLPVISSI